MTDRLTKEQRSYNMSMIRSRWTLPERKIHNMLKGMKIRHVMYPKIAGSPDIILPDLKTAVLIHGCFWHGCPRHFVMPQTRKKFWSDKIRRNIERDRKAVRKLRLSGWKVIKVWEHDTRRNPRAVVKKIIS